jgi:hypothetical protein
MKLPKTKALTLARRIQAQKYLRRVDYLERCLLDLARAVLREDRAAKDARYRQSLLDAMSDDR